MIIGKNMIILPFSPMHLFPSIFLSFSIGCDPDFGRRIGIPQSLGDFDSGIRS